jgi:hypothetical protein
MLAVLLIPSAVFLWRNSDLPQFGEMHDDGIFYVSAKSLAEGQYRIESLPETPWQTKYPPLYPLLLSVAWRLNPHFPENLHVAAWISWLAFPVLLLLLARYYPTIGMGGWRRWLLLALIAVNPYSLWFGATLLSEWLFTALLVATMLLIESAASPKSSIAIAAAAGLMAGAAYLARSAGIVLLASGFVYLWWFCRQRRKAWWFAGCMLPFIVCWMLWARIHELHTSDPALIYYIDYFRYEIYNVTPSNLYLVLWKNAGGFLWGLGSLILPKVIDSSAAKVLAQVIAVVMISGTVRLLRRPRKYGKPAPGLHYALFAAGSTFLLMIWHFPPNERFVLPLFPLALAGLLTEMENFTGLLRAVRRHPDRSQRVAGGLLALVAGTVFLGVFALQGYMDLVFVPQTFAFYRAQTADHRAAYTWMRSHVPTNMAVEAYDDPVLYLYTGRRSISRPLPPRMLYEGRQVEWVKLYGQLAAYARAHGADYVYFTSVDLRRDMSEQNAAPVGRKCGRIQICFPYFETAMEAGRFIGSSGKESHLLLLRARARLHLRANQNDRESRPRIQPEHAGEKVNGARTCQARRCQGRNDAEGERGWCPARSSKPFRRLSRSRWCVRFAPPSASLMRSVWRLGAVSSRARLRSTHTRRSDLTRPHLRNGVFHIASSLMDGSCAFRNS